MPTNPARARRPRYDQRTALLVVDVQNDFADPNGALSVRGGDAIVPVVNAAAREAQAAGAYVAYTQDWHPHDTPHFAKDGGIWPVHCLAGSWGAWLHPDLVVVGPSIHKGSKGEDGYSGFTMRDPVTERTTPTQLEGLLRARSIERVVIGGLATDYCVKATALDAVRLGFETTVLADAIAAVDLEPGDGDRAIEEMRAAGVTVAGGAKRARRAAARPIAGAA
ncbi:MAG TPA: isochorismatase family protein [Candidatus Limnocylindrales bacterium]|nr:isochorismatase family protein [Candidatus Limnocylindrales bacterium]